MRISSKAQSLVEYSALVFVIVLSLVAMQAYMKRGLQGRWRDSADQLGEQYDPKTMTGSTTHTMKSKTSTHIVGSVRNDEDNTTEEKTVSMSGKM
ncbi:MAG: hypothetical protein HQL21_04425 [Candidatus Omnitrophica bacterium]|nr:hypothetical protein [Candidatus Omnitrophota bacterium]